ncbi:MAG TPA: hypothetical protein VH877_24825 [Polyangia bacterium]|nr:hypothetical protein [Polyangia bacterium]
MARWRAMDEEARRRAVTDRSLAVTDREVLESRNAQGQPRFSLERVLRQLLQTAGVSNDARNLYQRLFDTSNTRGGAYVPEGPHCDDERDAQGVPAMNGFPIACPTEDGRLANVAEHDPFCVGPKCEPYALVGIFNRFDLADPKGQDCGEYRFIFAKGKETPPDGKAGNPPDFDRMFISFNAVVPSPRPERPGLDACAPLVEAWAGLSLIDDAEERARRIEALFFEGLPGASGQRELKPLFHVDHFVEIAGHRTGQIRTNSVYDPDFAETEDLHVVPHWRLREYKLRRVCAQGAACVLGVERTANETNPFGPLLMEDSAAGQEFRRQLLGQVGNLAASDPNLVSMKMTEAVNGAQSTVSNDAHCSLEPTIEDTRYDCWFERAPSSLRDELNRAIARLPDPEARRLTPENIVARAEAMTCAGCHESSNEKDLGNGLVWPRSLSFVHVSDTGRNPRTGQWRVSIAMEDVFLPFRAKNLEGFLEGFCGEQVRLSPSGGQK